MREEKRSDTFFSSPRINSLINRRASGSVQPGFSAAFNAGSSTQTHERGR